MLTRMRACEQLQKFYEREQAGTRVIFASNSSKGQILRALLNWMGPFNTPTADFLWRHPDRLRTSRETNFRLDVV